MLATEHSHDRDECMSGAEVSIDDVYIHVWLDGWQTNQLQRGIK